MFTRQVINPEWTTPNTGEVTLREAFTKNDVFTLQYIIFENDTNLWDMFAGIFNVDGTESRDCIMLGKVLMSLIMNGWLIYN